MYTKENISPKRLKIDMKWSDKFKTPSKTSSNLNSGLSLTKMIAAAARQQQLQMQQHQQQLLEEEEEDDEDDDENYEVEEGQHYKQQLQLHMHHSQHRMFDNRQIDDAQCNY